MFTTFNQTGLSLIQSLFDIYIFILLLRVSLQWVHTNPDNPIFILVDKLTRIPLKPICRIIPSLHGVNLAAVLLLLSLEATKIALFSWLQTYSTPHLGGLLILAFAELLHQVITLFFYTILTLAILSWVNPLAHGPLLEILLRISDPLLKPIRKLLPSFSGFDFSPLVLLIGLKVLTALLVQPLTQIGWSLMFG